MKIEVSYSCGKINFDIPQKNLAAIIRPKKAQIPLHSSQIAEVMTSKAAKEFENIVRDKNLCILVPDGTRDIPVEDILRAMGDILLLAKNIRFIICTGTHSTKTSQNELLVEQIIASSNSAGLKDFDIVVHDCEKAEFVDAGFTSRNTPVLYNAAIKDAEVFLALSDIKHHYFAGYSNPVKNFVPGICAYKTAEGNHSLSLDKRSRFAAHPWHCDKALQDNPLAKDQVEAMEKITNNRPFWTVAMISAEQQIQWLQIGKAEEVSTLAFSTADKWNIYDIEPVERMIVSPGQMPNDIDLYTAQRALELTKQAIQENGEILFTAACDNGVGSERTMAYFWNLLIRPMEEIFETIRNHQYKLFSHKPLRFAELIQHLRKLWIYSELSDDIIKAGHMSPASSVQDIVNRWIHENPDVKILVVDGANKLAIRAKK